MKSPHHIARIRQLECLILDGITLGDGRFFPLHWHRQSEAVSLAAGPFMWLEDWPALEEEHGLCAFDYLGQLQTATHCVRFGEGSHGSEGVACLLDASGQRIVWFVYLQYSNPFCKAEIQGCGPESSVLLHSTSGLVLHVPVTQPERIRIVQPPAYW